MNATVCAFSPTISHRNCHFICISMFVFDCACVFYASFFSPFEQCMLYVLNIIKCEATYNIKLRNKSHTYVFILEKNSKWQKIRIFSKFFVCLHLLKKIDFRCRCFYVYYYRTNPHKTKHKSVHNGADPTRPGECAAHEWQCDNRKCINIEFLCDRQQDCTDNSDEIRGCAEGKIV